MAECELKKNIVFELNNCTAKLSLSLDVLIDTGSPTSFIKQSFIPYSYVERKDRINNIFQGINGNKLSVLGTIRTDIRYDNPTRNNVLLYIVPDETMSSAAIIGRDVLKLFKVTLTTLAASVQENGFSEILNIDAVEFATSKAPQLNIDENISSSRLAEVENLFAEEYMKPLRAIEPKVKSELKLNVKELQAFHFSPRRLSYVEKE